MSALARNTAARLKGGGASITGRQIQRNVSTGAFEALTGTSDCLGLAVGGWHDFGSLETMDVARDAKSVHTGTLTMVEWDTARRNLLINVAPFSATASATKETLNLEDGMILEDSSATGEDTSVPYWEFIYRGAPLSTGKEVAFFCVGQFSRAGGPGASASGKYMKPKVVFSSVDAAGFVCTIPSTGDTWTVGIAPPTLSGNKAHGIWVEAT